MSNQRVAALLTASLDPSLLFGPPEAGLTARDAFRPDALGVAGTRRCGQTPGPLGPAAERRGGTPLGVASGVCAGHVQQLGGESPIGVKLAAHWVADIRLSFASGMGEAAMHVGSGLQEVIESDAADDGDEQHTSGDVPHAPERRGVDSVEQVLRGKKPGIPGRGRRTTRPG